MRKIGILLGITAVGMSLSGCNTLFSSNETQPAPPITQATEHSMPMAMEMDKQPHNYASNLPPSPMPPGPQLHQNGYAYAPGPQVHQNGYAYAPGPMQQQSAPMQSGGGQLAAASFGSMSAADRNRLTHGLDATPGKSTHWTNVSNGVTYTVTPTKKVVINNNRLCREYQTVAEKNGQRQVVNGTACITDDGNWHSMN